jgi:hypothetical protein
MINMNKVLCGFLLFLLIACSSEKPSEVKEQKPQERSNGAISETSQTASSAVGPYSVQIKPVPSHPTRSSVLYLLAQGFNPADVQIDWLVDGTPSPDQSGPQFKAEEARKGDSVQARVKMRGQEILSNIVQIENSPPSISKVEFVSDGLNPGDTLGVDATAADIDGDEVTIAYQWTKDGEPIGNGKSIAVPLKRGDNVEVRITPFDGSEYGHPAILTREITNMPPVIGWDKRFNFDGKVCSYQVKASDPDGDTLSYTLKSGPQGMTIDPSTGLVKWDVPENFEGKASFTVSVSDGHGGEASQKLAVEIGTEQK